jgi:hypothetical protein
MSLKAFHILFITVSALLFLFLIAWGYHSYSESHDTMSLSLGVIGFLALLLLISYGRWFWKKSKGLASVILVVLVALLAPLLLSDPLEACAVCFGDPSSLMVQSIKSGIWVLIAFIGAVLLMISSVAYSWYRRSKQLDSINQ